jgi:aspartate aminotransferase-like enzyme
MRSAEGFALLRDLVRKYGAITVSFAEADDPPTWRVWRAGHYGYARGETLEDAVAALWDVLEPVGNRRSAGS